MFETTNKIIFPFLIQGDSILFEFELELISSFKLVLLTF